MTSQTADYFQRWRHRSAGVDQSQFGSRCRQLRLHMEFACLHCGHVAAGWQWAHDDRQVSPPQNIQQFHTTITININYRVDQKNWTIF